MKKLLTNIMLKISTFINVGGLLKNVKTALSLLWSKGAVISLLLLLIFKYTGLGDAPFAELIYAGILVLTVAVLSPIIRLLVFAEAAELAESGGVRKLLRKRSISPELIHYWIATAISYIVTLLCVSSLL